MQGCCSTRGMSFVVVVEVASKGRMYAQTSEAIESLSGRIRDA